MITPAKLGWMAGVIDLRGRVYFKTNKQRAPGSPQIVLMVESRLPGIIRRLGELVGTKPEAKLEKPLKDFMRRSCSEHCPEAHIHVNDDRTMPTVYRWTITGVALAVIIDALEPYLTEDKGLPELKEQILASVDIGGKGAAAVMGAINRLMFLGWPMPTPITEVLERQQEALAILSGEGNE